MSFFSKCGDCRFFEDPRATYSMCLERHSRQYREMVKYNDYACGYYEARFLLTICANRFGMNDEARNKLYEFFDKYIYGDMTNIEQTSYIKDEYYGNRIGLQLGNKIYSDSDSELLYTIYNQLVLMIGEVNSKDNSKAKTRFINLIQVLANYYGIEANPAYQNHCIKKVR